MGTNRDSMPEGLRAKVNRQLAKDDARLPGAAPYVSGPKKSKYKNRRTYSEIIGRNFDSDGERRMGEWLFAMEKDGEISDIKYQVRVTLLGCVTMVVDFSYVEDDALIHHEFKGLAMDTWRLQKKLWGLVGPTEYRVSKAHQLWPAVDSIRPKPSDELCLYVLRHVLASYGVAVEIAQVIDELETL